MYLEKSDDPLLKLVNQHKESKKMYSIKKYTDKFKKELHFKELAEKSNESVIKFAKRVKQHAMSKEPGKHQGEMGEQSDNTKLESRKQMLTIKNNKQLAERNWTES